ARAGVGRVPAVPSGTESFSRARSPAYKRLQAAPAADLAGVVCRPPLDGFGGGYAFPVPLLEGGHVTADTGTGFVHTAPGHGREDFDIWTANARALAARGINTAIPYTVDGDGFFTDQAPGFKVRRVITYKGDQRHAS